MKKSRGFSNIGAVIAVIAVIAFISVMTYLVIDGNNRATDFTKYSYYSVIEGTEDNGGISDHVKTDADGTYTGAPVYVFEYADFQCPGCASLNSKVNQAVDESDGKLAVVYRNYLLSYHQNATAAASAAEAAGFQGYWKEYADLLFSNQSEWEYLSGSERTSTFERYFVQVTGEKADLDKFRSDIASEAVSKKISFDMGIGKRVDVSGTPAFYVNGQFIAWNNSEGGAVEVNGETISWNSSLSGSEFVEILKKIAEAGTSK